MIAQHIATETISAREAANLYRDITACAKKLGWLGRMYGMPVGETTREMYALRDGLPYAATWVEAESLDNQASELYSAALDSLERAHPEAHFDCVLARAL